jgi:hypothetical protein
MKVQFVLRLLLTLSLTLTVILLTVQVVFAVTEIDVPGCRWPHTTGSYTYVYYKWGSNLQTPGGPWRIAYEASVNNWALAPTKIIWRYSVNGSIVLNTYWAQDGYAGYATPRCSGSTTVGFDVMGNVYYDIAQGYSNNRRQSVTGHETGHSQSLGHISGTGAIALLGFNPDPNKYYTAQPADINLTNQVYP